MIPFGFLRKKETVVAAYRPFITTWRTTAANETIEIPVTGVNHNYDIVTSDGQSFTGETGSKTITFPTAGDYDISISGDFPRIYFQNQGSYLKIIDIKQWGDIVWYSFRQSFHGCANLVGTYTDIPNVTNVRDYYAAFYNASLFNGSVLNWPIHNVNSVTMQYMLGNASNFDKSLASWDITTVWNMSYLLSNVQISVANYDATLIGWEATLQAAFPNGVGYGNFIAANFGSSKYTGTGAAMAARTSLINNFNMSFVDWGSV
jgi:hypothetical protein